MWRSLPKPTIMGHCWGSRAKGQERLLQRVANAGKTVAQASNFHLHLTMHVQLKLKKNWFSISSRGGVCGQRAHSTHSAHFTAINWGILGQLAIFLPYTNHTTPTQLDNPMFHPTPIPKATHSFEHCVRTLRPMKGVCECKPP